MEIEVIAYLARRMTIDVPAEAMDDDDVVRRAIWNKLYFELGLSDEDVAIDDWEQEVE